MARLRGLSIAILTFCVSTTTSAATLTVDLNGTGDFVAIQPAIDAAMAGDTVLVKPGEYVIANPIDFNRLHRSEDSSSPPVKEIAVVSEGGPERTAIRKSLLQTEGFYRCVVIFKNGEGESSLLLGFTLTSSAFEPAGDGGSTGIGVMCFGSSPTIERCIVMGNVATGSQSGGGIFCHDGSPTIIDCDIVGNSTGYDTDSGGGISCHYSSPLVIGCRIVGNSASSAPGGGVHCRDSPLAVFIDCTIMGNVASTGGGMNCSGSSPTLINCVIAGNATEFGGGLYINGNPTLVNCTIAQNFAPEGCQDVCCSYGSIRATNCIFGEEFSVPPGGEGCSKNVSHSVVMGLVVPPGEGNTNEDPLFVKVGVFDFKRTRTFEVNGQEFRLPDFIVEAPDYHLQASSPCIDAGTSEGAPPTDIDGHGRPCGNGVDMGVYESGDCAPPTKFQRGNVDEKGDIEITDVLATLNYLFLGQIELTCLDAADSNDDGRINIVDPIYSLQFMYHGGSPPVSPYPGCGIDEWIDGLDCNKYQACE